MFVEIIANDTMPREWKLKVGDIIETTDNINSSGQILWLGYSNEAGEQMDTWLYPNEYRIIDMKFEPFTLRLP